MNELALQVEPPPEGLRPGGELAVQVRWDGLQRPRRVLVRLFWFTQGKGTQDVHVVGEFDVPDPAPAGQQRFEIVLPPGPYSYSGRLISLTWAVEAIREPGGRVERFEFVLSPDGRPVEPAGPEAAAAPASGNPFASERMHAIPYRLEGTTWDELLGKLEQYGWRGAIVGPEGCGKTTLLEELGRRLVERGVAVRSLRLPPRPGQSQVALLRELHEGLGGDEVVLLDGAEQLGWAGWRIFKHMTRTMAGLVVTSHRPGLLPTLIECNPSPAALDYALDELLGERADAVRDQAHDLYRRHRGNIRQVLRDLYDRHAGQAVTSTADG